MEEGVRKKSSPIKDFISGGFGGVCTVVSGHPLDTIKVRLQTMPKPAPGQSPMYLGTFDCAKKTVAAEGVRGLYKGMATLIAGVAPIFAVSFFGFSLGKTIQQSSADKPLGKKELFLAGGLAGVFTTSITAPGERIKTLLQLQRGGAQVYSGPVDVIRKLYQEGGVRSIFRGTLATLLRDVPASGMYFMTYESIKELLKSSNQTGNIGLPATIFAGGMAGMANWIVAMPADVLKSRLQSTAGETRPSSMRNILVQLLQDEGPLALYKGITPVMLRAFPANAACFIGYEFALKFLDWCLPDL